MIFLSEAYAITLKPDPLIGGLGATLNKADKCLSQAVPLSLVLAEQAILQMWKEKLLPIFELWLREQSSLLHLEELRYHLNKM